MTPYSQRYNLQSRRIRKLGFGSTIRVMDPYCPKGHTIVHVEH